MKSTNPFFKILLMTLVSLISSTAMANADWTFCYNSNKNRVYFQTITDLEQNNGACLGKTYFQSPEEELRLIVDEKDAKGFPRGLPGTAVNMTLRTGKQILITQWNDLSKYNVVMVLEPNQKTKKVKKHCQYKNYSSHFRGRYNAKLKQFEVLINEPVSTYSENFHKVWKKCF